MFETRVRSESEKVFDHVLNDFYHTYENYFNNKNIKNSSGLTLDEAYKQMMREDKWKIKDLKSRLE